MWEMIPIPIAIKELRKGGKKLKPDTRGAIFERRAWVQCGMGGLCVLLMFSRKRAFEDCVLEVDCRFRKFPRWPLSEVPAQSIAMLKRSDISMDQDAWDLVYRKLSMQKGDIYKKMIKNGPSVAINKRRATCVSGNTFCAPGWRYLIGRPAWGGGAGDYRAG